MNRARSHIKSVRNSKNPSAFTILELLAVVAIIIILVGLLMPSLSRVRQISTRMVCGSYLSSYGKISMVYFSDNDDTFPSDPNQWLYSNASISKEHPIGCRWHDRQMAPDSEIMTNTKQYQGSMWQYFDETKTMTCPTFRRYAPRKGCQNPDHPKSLPIKPQYSYSMNAYLGSSAPGGVKKISQVRDTSQVFFFAEENSWTIPKGQYGSFKRKTMLAPLSTRALDNTVLSINAVGQPRDCFATYHSDSSKDIDRGFANVVFIDGHVEPIKFKDQLRKTLHGGNSSLGPAGNLALAWASEQTPPGDWGPPPDDYDSRSFRK